MKRALIAAVMTSRTVFQGSVLPAFTERVVEIDNPVASPSVHAGQVFSKNLERADGIGWRAQYSARIQDARGYRLAENFGGKFGGNSGGNSQRKHTQKRMLIKQAAKRLIIRNGKRKHGGRSRNRTYDLAHVRRAL